MTRSGIEAADTKKAAAPREQTPFELAQLAGFAGRAADGSAPWLEPLRRAAFDRFAALGLPTTRDEDWRFTSVSPIGKIPFVAAASGRGGSAAARAESAAGLAPASPGREVVPPSLAVAGPFAAAASRSMMEASYGLEAAHRLVFVNGRFSPGLSTSRALPPGVKLGSLGEALAASRALVEEHLGRHASFENSAFVALNTALFEDGVFLFVPDGVVLEEPVLIVHLASGAGAPGDAAPLASPRHLLLLGRGSQATVIESYAGVGSGAQSAEAGSRHDRTGGPSGTVLSPRSKGDSGFGPGASDATFTNAVTEIAAGDGAVLEHYKLQDEPLSAFHIATTQARLAGGSVMASHSVSLGGSLVRNDLNVVLGEGAECSLNGLFIARGAQHVDNHTLIDHARAHGTSRELYKGILDGRARGVFDGKVVVRPDAQKTDSRQVNRNLLLSDGALVDTKPQLEIRADDVKCAHAATIGRLDETMLFYLRSRGLGLDTARALLIRAFASEATAPMKLQALRARVEERVASLLSSGGGAGEAS